MANRYIYQRTGGPLVTWDRASGRPPGQARGADTVSLGSLGGEPFDLVEFDGRPLPKPGAPEYLSGMGAVRTGGCCDDCSCGSSGGCPDCAGGRKLRAAGRVGSGIGSKALGCAGGCGCKGSAMGDVASFVSDNAVLLAAGAAAYFLFFKKKRRR